LNPTQVNLAQELWDELNQSDHRGLELTIKVKLKDEKQDEIVQIERPRNDWLNPLLQIKYKEIVAGQIDINKARDKDLNKIFENIDPDNARYKLYECGGLIYQTLDVAQQQLEKENNKSEQLNLSKYGKFKKYWTPQLTDLCVKKNEIH
jgi:hypothetical protein